eukprot:4280097-Pleurochrysis_carterae.AAC.1
MFIVWPLRSGSSSTGLRLYLETIRVYIGVIGFKFVCTVVCNWCIRARANQESGCSLRDGASMRACAWRMDPPSYACLKLRASSLQDARWRLMRASMDVCDRYPVGCCGETVKNTNLAFLRFTFC